MTLDAKLRVLMGTLLVVTLCGAIVVWQDGRRAIVSSDTAEISAKSYNVGIDYSGLITRQFVEAGSMVEKDDVLFHVKSTNLTERINELNLQKSSLLYDLNDEGEVVITATRPGLVSEIRYGQGSFVPANETLAIIIDQQVLEVVANYQLARRDFNKLATDVMLQVRLPGGAWTEGKIRNIQVTEQLDNKVLVEITASIPGAGENSFRSSSGVPVDTKLQIQEATLYNRLSALVKQAKN